MGIIQPRADVIVRCRVKEGLQIGWKQEARRTTKQGRRRCARATSSDCHATGSGPREELVPLGISGDAASFGIGADRESTDPDSTARPWRRPAGGSGLLGRGIGRGPAGLGGAGRAGPVGAAPLASSAHVNPCGDGRSVRGVVARDRDGRSSGCPGSSRPSGTGGSPSSRAVWRSSFRRYWQVMAIVLDGTDEWLASEPIQPSVTLLEHDPSDRLRHRRARSTPVSTNSVSSQSEPSTSTPGTAPASLSAGSGTDSSSPVPSSAGEQVSGSHESASTGKANGGSSSGTCRSRRTLRTRTFRMTARSKDLRPPGSCEEVG